MEPQNNIQNPVQNPSPVNPLQPPQFQYPPQPKSSIGGIIGTIIIIAIIILGGLYFWGKRIEESKARQDMVTDTSTQETQLSEGDQIKNVNSSDDLNTLEADLNATKLEGLGTEMDAEAAAQ